jgi:t-SNARE complex subunit (syntaxin)
VTVGSSTAKPFFSGIESALASARELEQPQRCSVVVVVVVGVVVVVVVDVVEEDVVVAELVELELEEPPV